MAKEKKITNAMQEVASDILIRLIIGCPDFSEELSKVYDEVYKYYKLCDDPYTHLPCSCKEYSENSLKLDKELMMEKYGHCDGLE